jgi:hypothetical protein
VSDNEIRVLEVDVLPGMVIRPGDVLVVGCETPISLERAAELREGLLERMPGLADVVVLAPPLSIAAVYRRDVADDTDPLGRGDHD